MMKNILTFILILFSSIGVFSRPTYKQGEISIRLSKSENFYKLYQYACKNIIYLSHFHAQLVDETSQNASGQKEINDQFANSIGYGTLGELNLVVQNLDFLRTNLVEEFPELKDFEKSELEEVIIQAESMLSAEKRQASNPKLTECVQNAANRESSCLQSAARGFLAVRVAAGVTFASCMTAAIVVTIAAAFLGEVISAGAGTVAIVAAISGQIGGIVGGCTGIAAVIFGTAYEVSNAAKDQCKQERLIEIRKCVVLYK